MVHCVRQTIFFLQRNTSLNKLYRCSQTISFAYHPRWNGSHANTNWVPGMTRNTPSVVAMYLNKSSTFSTSLHWFLQCHAVPTALATIKSKILIPLWIEREKWAFYSSYQTTSCVKMFQEIWSKGLQTMHTLFWSIWVHLSSTDTGADTWKSIPRAWLAKAYRTSANTLPRQGAQTTCKLVRSFTIITT